MLAQELIDEVKASLASGSDPAAIKSDLRSRGIANDEIDAAFVAAQSLDKPEDGGMSNSKKEVFIAIIVTIALGIAGVALAYFSGK